MTHFKTELPLTKQADRELYSNTGSQQAPAVTQGQRKRNLVGTQYLLELNTHCTPNGEKVNECLEKPYEWLHMHTISDILSQANRAYSTLSRKLEAVNKVSTVQASAKAKNYFTGVNKAKCLPPTKVTYSHTGFHNGQAKYFNMNVQKTADLLSWCTGGIVTVYCYMSRISQT